MLSSILEYQKLIYFGETIKIITIYVNELGTFLAKLCESFLKK